MRIRPTILATLTASFGLLLGSCTADTGPGPSPTGQAGQELDGAPGTGEAPERAGSTAAPVGGHLCRYVSPGTQHAVAGQDLLEPSQLIVANDPDSWVCEARDGDRGLVRVSILRGEGVWRDQRALAQEQEGVTEGPEWLGESYRSARRVTGLTMCSTVVDGEATYEPYALVVEAVVASDEDVSGALSTTASTLARSMDQSVGCSPRMARGEIPGPTPGG